MSFWRWALPLRDPPISTFKLQEQIELAGFIYDLLHSDPRSWMKWPSETAKTYMDELRAKKEKK